MDSGRSRRPRAGGSGNRLLLHTRRSPPQLHRGGYPRLRERGRYHGAVLAGGPRRGRGSSGGQSPGRGRSPGTGRPRGVLQPGGEERRAARALPPMRPRHPLRGPHSAHDRPGPGRRGGEKPLGDAPQAVQPEADGGGGLCGTGRAKGGGNPGTGEPLPLLGTAGPGPGAL